MFSACAHSGGLETLQEHDHQFLITCLVFFQRQSCVHFLLQFSLNNFISVSFPVPRIPSNYKNGFSSNVLNKYNFKFHKISYNELWDNLKFSTK